MIISQDLQDTIFEVNTLEELKDRLVESFTTETYKPNVRVNGNAVEMEIDDALVERVLKGYKKAVEHADGGDLDKAEEEFMRILNLCPAQSLVLGNLGRLYFRRGDMEQARHYLTRSLQVAPRDMWEGIMLGNTYLTQGQIDEAEKQYRRVMEFYPDNAVALSNVGAAYLERKDTAEARKYFEQALQADPAYPNANYGMVVTYLQEQKWQEAFDTCLTGLQATKAASDSTATHGNMVKSIMALAEQLTGQTDYKALTQALKNRLEQNDGKKIEVVEDDKIEHSATLKVARAQGNEAHVISYQPGLPFTDYLVLRKLLQLEMVQQARKAGRNKVVESTAVNEQNFKRRFSLFFSNFLGKMDEERLNAFQQNVWKGFSHQLRRFAFDMIIEDKIYFDHPQYRPLQLLALTRQEQESLAAIGASKELSMMPPTLVSATRIMILTASLYFTNLYGINLMTEYRGTEKEYKKVDELYDEFLNFLDDDPKPGDEYQLAADFAEELGFADLMTVHGESGLIL